MPESTTTSTVDDSVAGRSVSGAPIELAHVTKRYAGQQAPAVDDFSMHINAGEIVVFVGPSGCGKTTTMKMINRLIEPSAGRIMLGDQDVTKLEPAQLRRRIGYAIQQVGLFPHMTIAQNIGQVPAMLKWDRQRIRARVDEMLELTGLDPDAYRGRFPRQLSGGQQQRVGVARALAADPPVLLMDEPFGAVDPITRGNLQDELLNLQSQLGKTIVFVTHDFDEAIKLGDRIAVLGNQSKILQYDTPEAILAAPADDTVAGFVGSGATIRQLGLKRVHHLQLGKVATAPLGVDAEAARQTLGGGKHLLLLDKRNRPVEWLSARALAKATGSVQHGDHLVGDTVTRRSTLVDALDAILTEGGGYAAVTGERGEYVGTVQMEQIMATITEIREAQDTTPTGSAG
ncbi:ATP-binding cassette domain-containing protein [Fodinicola feengrottensis]|uniref:ATP-binding cassette domain-containing protein n=1 Tax=Fodinicola feengrottensis TaxID=435914 RepID=A0ABN2GFF1_9ACTN